MPVWEKFWISLPSIPGLPPTPPTEIKLPFRIETGEFTADRTGPVRVSFSKAYPDKPTVSVMGFVRTGTMPTPPKVLPTTKITPPTFPALSEVTVPSIVAPPVKEVAVPEVKISPIQALFPSLDVKLGFYGCDRTHKVGEVTVESTYPLPFRGIKELAIVWYTAEKKEVKRDKVSFPEPRCPLCFQVYTRTFPTEADYKRALWNFWFRLGQQGAPWGFGWIAGRITGPLASGVDGLLGRAVEFGEYLGGLGREEIFNALARTTTEVNKGISELTSRVTETFKSFAGNVKTVVDSAIKSFSEVVNSRLLSHIRDDSEKSRAVIENLKAELTRFTADINRALEVETKNAEMALKEATDNIKMMAGLREGVLLTPVSVSEVTTTGFTIEAVKGSRYQWIAIGPS
jgi:hypothetical protein